MQVYYNKEHVIKIILNFIGERGMNFMKKYTYVLLLFSMLLVFVLVHSGCSNGDKSSPTYEPTENVEPNSLKSDYATQEPENQKAKHRNIQKKF